jgi:hypothetical protein
LRPTRVKKSATMFPRVTATGSQQMGRTMPGRLLRLSVLALAGGLMAVLVGHMWGRYSQQADASGLERYLGAYVVPASKDLEPYQSAEGRSRAAGAQEASALHD